ncbi:epoxide hydrolase [Moniliophthora roreri]|nr:epoxide hydrolase [Moniliophthora roreri]
MPYSDFLPPIITMNKNYRDRPSKRSLTFQTKLTTPVPGQDWPPVGRKGGYDWGKYKKVLNEELRGILEAWRRTRVTQHVKSDDSSVVDTHV